MGSPLVWGSTISCRVFRMLGCLFWMVLRPPPFLRLLPICGGVWFGLFSSFMPFVMVLRVVFESWLTVLIPPCPMVFASVARYRRRWYSFSEGNIVSMRVCSAITSILGISDNTAYTYLN